MVGLTSAACWPRVWLPTGLAIAIFRLFDSTTLLNWKQIFFFLHGTWKPKGKIDGTDMLNWKQNFILFFAWYLETKILVFEIPAKKNVCNIIWRCHQIKGKFLWQAPTGSRLRDQCPAEVSQTIRACLFSLLYIPHQYTYIDYW